MEYALGRAFSPFEWLDYGEPTLLDRARDPRAQALAGLAIFATAPAL